MGAAYFITLDKEVEFDTFVNGKFLASSSEQLAQFCEKHAIPSPDHFCSMNGGDILEELGEFDLDEFDIPESEEKWFTPEEGRAWVGELISKLNSESFPNAVEALISDLNEYLLLFEKLRGSHIRWHLEIDF